MSATKDCRVNVEHCLHLLETEMHKISQDVLYITNASTLSLETNDFVTVFSDLRSMIDSVRTLRTLVAIQMNAEMPGVVSMVAAQLADAMNVLLDLDYLARLGRESIAEVIEDVAATEKANSINSIDEFNA